MSAQGNQVIVIDLEGRTFNLQQMGSLENLVVFNYKILFFFSHLFVLSLNNKKTTEVFYCD